MSLVLPDGTPATSEFKVDMYSDGSVGLNDILYPAPTDIAAFVRSCFGTILVQMIAEDSGVELPKVTPTTWKLGGIDKEQHIVTFLSESTGG